MSYQKDRIGEKGVLALLAGHQASEWATVATTVCTMTEAGHVSIDAFKRTSGPGVYAAGDNSAVLRSVANSIGAGNIAGNIMNHDLITEEA